MANKRIKDLTEKSSFVSGDYFPIDNDNGTKKVNASKIMSPLSSAQTDATRALNMARNTSSFPTGDAYSSSSSYKVGNMVIYNNTLYRCKTACSAASWSVNANNFEAISLASALTDLNNDLSFKQFGNYVAGTSSINISTLHYKELLFVLTYEQSNNCTIMTANTLKEIIEAKSAFNAITAVGYALTGAIGGVGFLISNKIVTLNFAYVGSTDIKSFEGTKFGIYYR